MWWKVIDVAAINIFCNNMIVTVADILYLCLEIIILWNTTWMTVKSRGETGNSEESLGPEKKKYMSTCNFLSVLIILAVQESSLASVNLVLSVGYHHKWNGRFGLFQIPKRI